MASTTIPTTATAIDKSKPYFPIAGLANDGWSNENEATATCFCGAVQLAFVSTNPSLRINKPNTNSLLPANPWSRLLRLFRLQLFRLPQTYGIHVRNQFHRLRFAPKTLARAGEPEDLQTIKDHFGERRRQRQQHDELLLLNLRLAHVPCRRRFPGLEYPACWQRG
jgi:hypothetical protein